jgi:peptidoglycan/LPS O-acetylase OafA/YrhL
VIEVSTYGLPVKKWHGVPVSPTTRPGRWAVALAVVSGIGWLIALPAIVFAPDEGIWIPWGLLLLIGLVPGISCAIAAPIVAFVVMVRRGERALSVYLGYVPVLCILLGAVLGSLLSG